MLALLLLSAAVRAQDVPLPPASAPLLRAGDTPVARIAGWICYGTGVAAGVTGSFTGQATVTDAAVPLLIGADGLFAIDARPRLPTDAAVRLAWRVTPDGAAMVALKGIW
jgi:hypothetical protein